MTEEREHFFGWYSRKMHEWMIATNGRPNWLGDGRGGGGVVVEEKTTIYVLPDGRPVTTLSRRPLPPTQHPDLVFVAEFDGYPERRVPVLEVPLVDPRTVASPLPAEKDEL